LPTKKQRTKNDGIFPIVGKIIIGRSIAQFSSKLKAPERLWHVKSGRATGKSREAVTLNREISFPPDPLPLWIEAYLHNCLYPPFDG
jgi:hypothetical protein